jgi:hypothetical protein
MKYRITTLLTSLLFSACAAGPTYLGHAVSETSYKVDGGKTIKLPITRAGALPVENENYKIEGAGVIASMTKGDPSNSKITWTFSFVSKKSAELDSVVVEQVTDSGGLELAVKDNTPSLKNKNWVGRSATASMTKESSPWLYSSSNSTFVFKFTIKAKDGSAVVMYQPSIISSRAKAMYLTVISSK